MSRLIRRSARKVLPELPRSGPFAYGTILLLAVTTILAAAFVWLIPMDVVRQWAYDRAGNGPFERFESVGEAEFSLWLARIALSCMAILQVGIWWSLDRCLAFARDVWNGLITLSAPVQDQSSTKARPVQDQWSGIAFRGFLVAWAVLAVSHAVHALGLQIHDWPYFRFNSGDIVLPNISNSNRAVIRYLKEATPPGARILVASDQKLFFLSYYLRPRILFHRMHPDSEHVIPLKDQERKLVAYRLDELTDQDLKQMPHEYTLEYFEHPDFVDSDDVLDDANWVEFIRRQERDRSFVPKYLVRLRRIGQRREGFPD